MKDDKYPNDSIISLDIDETLFIGQKRALSAVGVKILKIGEVYGREGFGTTNRTIVDLVKHILRDLEPLPDGESSLSAIEFLHNFYKDDSSFYGILKKISANKINIPFKFITPFDYFLSPEQQSTYYLNVDSFTIYVTQLMAKIIEKNLTLTGFISWLKQLKKVITDNISTSFPELKCSTADTELLAIQKGIQKLVEQERDLYTQFRTKQSEMKLGGKDFQFLCIHRLT